MKKIKGLILALLPFLVNAQTQPTILNFKTPEVSAFNKNIETPVSMYSGIPNISIPLYEISIKGVSIPITLDYNAGGIRVDQEATWVGLGWSLNYGGAISRKVRGAPDEKFYLGGINNNNATVSYFLQLPYDANVQGGMAVRRDYLYPAKLGNSYDYMPDEFFYSSLGYSGKFMFSQGQNKFITFPHEDIDIQQTVSPPNQYGNTFRLYSFNMKMPDGTAVNFGKESYSSQTDMPKVADNTKNAWYVNRIDNVFGDSIVYTYEPFTYTTYKLSGENYSIHTDGTPSGGQISYSKADFHDSRVTMIKYPGGTINFISANREDMSTKALTEIDILDNSGNIIRKVIFNYTYFYGSDFDMYPLLDGTSHVPADYRFKRLRLDQVKISDKDVVIQKKYSFDYNTKTQMPSKYAFSQDHWGYYNGIANTSIYSFIPNLDPSLFTGGDRRVKPINSDVFSLKSLTYPEGGKTEFIYENNTAGLWNTPDYLVRGYQDDNFIDKSANINISGYSRTNFNPTPDQTTSCTKYFRKQFTVAPGGSSYLGLGWQCSTNFGIDSWENTMAYNVDNVEFKLEKINADLSRTTVKTFNTTNTNFPCSTSCPRIGTDNNAIGISAGNYEMTVIITYCSSDPGNHNYTLNFGIKWRELDPTTKMVYTGGLRIKDINYYTSGTNLARKKHYEYVNPYADASLPSFTSGRVVSFPNYFQNKVQNKGTNPLVGINVFDFTSVFSSNSSLPLETTSGSYSGYEYVNEYDIDYSNSPNTLKTSYKFSFNAPYFSQYYNYMNLGAWESAEWTRGKLLSKQFYKGSNVIGKEDYTYYAYSPHLTSDLNEDFVDEINLDFISSQYFSRICQCDPYSNPYPADFYDVDQNQPFVNGGANTCIITRYGAGYYQVFSSPNSNGTCQWTVDLPYFKHYSAFDKLKNKITTTTDDNGNQMVQTENYYYSSTPSHYQLTKTEAVTSKGDLVSSTKTYPADYSTTVPYTLMLQRHMIAYPVLQSNFKGSTFLQSTKTNYQDFGNNIIAPSSIESKIGTNATETSAFFYNYDSKGNLLTAAKKDDIRHSYLWDVNQLYMVAHASNANSDEIAYTSFEADSKGNWMYMGGNVADVTSPTGANAYALSSGNITKSAMPLGKNYFLTYWIKNGSGTISINGGTGTLNTNLNGWSLYTLTIMPGTAVTISGTATIDEVRLYPQNSFFETAQYISSVGIKSTADANNKISKYEYDAFGRLVLIRDLDNNIIKKICYNYAGQAVDCSSPCINTSPNWQNTTDPLRCQTNACGNTGYQEQKQQDMNPCSASYNLTRWLQGTNATACTPSAGANIIAQNAENISGYVAAYTNTTTNVTTTFTILNGTNVIGCLPAAKYNISIYKLTGFPPLLSFACGSFTASGNSATFNNVSLFFSGNRTITIASDF